MTITDIRPVCCTDWHPSYAGKLVGRVCRYCMTPIAVDPEHLHHPVACVLCCVARGFILLQYGEPGWETAHG